MRSIFRVEVYEDIRKLTKHQIGELLNLTQKEVVSTKKDQLLSTLTKELKDNDHLIQKIYKNFSFDLGIHPNKVEKYLNITKTERFRWTEQKKLRVVRYSSFNKWGKTLDYPIYDTYQIKNISQEQIVTWRQEHKKEVEENRKKAVHKALITRKLNNKKNKDFYENKWKKLLKDWYTNDNRLGASLQLAYWTMWVSRWAKEFQLLALDARINKDKYIEKKELFYEMKNVAIQRLIASPYTKISFYQPQAADKITHLEFCPDHFQLWLQEREFDYVSKQEFYYSYIKDIHKCVSCELDIEKNYYSLYFISILFGEYHFSFHTPYPIGKSYLPPKDSLPLILHEEQEGLFRFGRSLIGEEKIIFKEKEVIKYFNEALTKFDLYIKAEDLTLEESR